MAVEPPLAPTEPVAHTHHGDTVVDEYDWLRDADDPRVLEHLGAENEFCDEQTQHLAPLVAELVDDLKARTAETELSVPQLVHHELDGERRTYWYYGRTVEGDQYPTLSRLPLVVGVPPSAWSGPDGEEVLFDGESEARGSGFFGLGSTRVSPDGRLLASTVDRDGDERYELRIRDLTTKMPVDEPLRGVSRMLVWFGSSRLCYLRQDDRHRPFQVLQHRLGTSEAEDKVLYAEEDERFRVAVRESRDGRWLLITTTSLTSSETRICSLAEPDAPLRLVTPRREGVRYRVEVAGDRLLITHNEHDADFELAQAPLECTSAAQWAPLIPHEDGVRITRADAYRQHVVVSLRRAGLAALHIVPRIPNGGLGRGEDVVFAEPVYNVRAAPGPNYDDVDVRLSYSSLLTPPAILGYNVLTRTLRTLKEMPVLPHPQRGPYQPSDHLQRREWAQAADGTLIPISLVASRKTFADGPAPTVVYGYGAYEYPVEPEFDGLRLSLLDRGFVFAIAHVRGGGELGRPWHLAGRREQKPTSFTDFIACTERLIELGISDPDRIGAQGASAGGLLVAAAVNLRPDLYRAVHADVPFVDPLTTGLDPSQPLTITEWDQWGDPLHDPEAYATIKDYSPYENIRPVRYPAVLATASLNDTRVSYAEAAKWVARLRATTPADAARPILLRTALEAGHGGPTGRYAQWNEEAFRLAWLIDQLAADHDGADAPEGSS